METNIQHLMREHRIASVQDCDSFKALEYAYLFKKGLRYPCVMAAVHGSEGLVIIYHASELGRGLHFAHAVCGYDGTGPRVTAEILELFGFGPRDLILERITEGGRNAYYEYWLSDITEL